MYRAVPDRFELVHDKRVRFKTNPLAEYIFTKTLKALAQFRTERFNDPSAARPGSGYCDFEAR